MKGFKSNTLGLPLEVNPTVQNTLPILESLASTYTPLKYLNQVRGKRNCLAYRLHELTQFTHNYTQIFNILHLMILDVLDTTAWPRIALKYFTYFAESDGTNPLPSRFLHFTNPLI